MNNLVWSKALMPLLCAFAFTFAGCVKDNRAADEADDSATDAEMTSGDQDGGLDTPETCEPGESIAVDCNTCVCPESGLVSEAEDCTEEDCTAAPEADMGPTLTVVDMEAPEPEPEPNPEDSDGDGIPDDEDNCPALSNADQQDEDGNGVGDLCELVDDDDNDQDGIANSDDNCPLVANNSQTDDDEDGIGNRCDNCPDVANAGQEDSDANGQGDVCADRDGDGVFDSSDNCIEVPNGDQADGDEDGLGDRCDNCPNQANADQADANSNNIGDACEIEIGDDADLDGIADDDDNCSATPNRRQVDGDDDGVGDACDNCPNTPNANQAPSNVDGIGEACAASRDIDDDGVIDAEDNCPTIANGNQSDRDDDGVGNECDNCPSTPNNNQADVDLDGDGDVCDVFPDGSPATPRLIVELIWGDERADFDLHMVGPYGTFFGNDDCWSLNRRTAWCSPGYQFDSPQDEDAPGLYEQIRIGLGDDGETAPNALHTIGVDLFPTDENVGGGARVVVRCGEEDPVELGPWVFGTAVSGQARSFAEVAHVNPSTCEVTSIQAFRTVSNCPGEGCDRSDNFVGGVCSPEICPDGATCDVVSGECIDLCGSQTCDEGLICEPETGDCIETPISDWGNGSFNDAPYCNSDSDCEFTEECVRFPGFAICGIPCGSEGDVVCPEDFFCCDFRRSPDYCIPEGEQLGQRFNCQ